MAKINTRSPFYVSFGEPVQQAVTFDCGIAKGNEFEFQITERGELILTDLAQGTIESISSTDSDFANDKFPDESVDTNRTITLRIAIPSGFTNSSDGFFNCDVDAVQPAFNAGTTCTVNTTLNGTIADQTLTTKGGTSSAIDLSTKFTEGSYPILGYRVFNGISNLVSTTAISATGGKSQSIQFTAQENCGSGKVHIYALDRLTATDGTGSCTAHQPVNITVNGCSDNFDCTLANLQGGAVAQNGEITMPTASSTIPATGSVSTNSDGSSPIAGSQPFSTSANGGGAAQNVTLYFKVLIPSGYANTGDGSQYIWCGKTFEQQAASTLPTWTCDTLNHTGYAITSRGSIIAGTVQNGVVKSFTPNSFETVLTDTTKTVTFILTSRANGDGPDHSNPSADISCAKNIVMPAYTPVCGTFAAYITQPFIGGTSPLIEMDSTKTYAATQSIGMNVSFANLTIGARTCYRGSPFRGNNFWYGIRDFSAAVGAGQGAGVTVMIYVDEYGIIQNIAEWNADLGNGGTGGIR